MNLLVSWYINKYISSVIICNYLQVAITLAVLGIAAAEPGYGYGHGYGHGYYSHGYGKQIHSEYSSQEF